MISKKYLNMILIFLVIGYLVLQLTTLTAYPYIHSDESWLSGFSRTALDKGTFSTSEPFFDLYPRAVHGLRVIFSIVQIIFMSVLGYSIFSMRMVSLVFSLLSLWIIYRCWRFSDMSKALSLLSTGLIGLSIQFFMMSHVARQEPLILFGMVLCYHLVDRLSNEKIWIISSIIGLCIGIHPNSFLIACGIGLVLLYKYFCNELRLSSLILFVVTISVWATVFIGISFSLNTNFVAEYLSFGDQLGVINNSINRFQGFYYYYYKLFHQIGGTYLLVNIKAELGLIGLAIILGILTTMKTIKSNTTKSYTETGKALFMILGLNLGLLIIGRYNQTAIIFPLVFGWFLIVSLLRELYQFTKMLNLIPIVLTALLILQGYNLSNHISKSNYQSYDELGASINEIIPMDAVILGNLNMDYHFELYQLFDVRNLAYLDRNGLSLDDYISKNNITYVILYDEMTYIHDSKGKWDILYGDLSYYDDLLSYLSTNGELVGAINAPTYAMRISKYVDVYPWEMKIYKLNNSN